MDRSDWQTRLDCEDRITLHCWIGSGQKQIVVHTFEVTVQVIVCRYQSINADRIVMYQLQREINGTSPPHRKENVEIVFWC